MRVVRELSSITDDEGGVANIELVVVLFMPISYWNLYESHGSAQ